MSGTVQVMNPRQLFELVRELWGQEDEALLRTVEEQWPAMESRPAAPEDAETCRLATLAAAGLSRHALMVLWQARAYAKFIALDWREGVASVVMSNAFRLLAMANDDYIKGRTHDVLRAAPEAVKVLEALRPFAVGPGSGFDVGPTPALIARFIDEKSGFLLSLEQRWDEAEAAYDRALVHTAGESRGQAKVPLGQELVRYLRDRAAGGDGRAAAGATARLAHDPRTLKHDDLRETAATNEVRMLAGRADVIPYEIL